MIRESSTQAEDHLKVKEACSCWLPQGHGGTLVGVHRERRGPELGVQDGVNCKSIKDNLAWKSLSRFPERICGKCCSELTEV